MRPRIAAKIDEADKKYFKREIEPLLDHPLVELVGEINEHGDIGVVGNSAHGLFFRDTRHLSFLRLTIEGMRPLLLGSVVQDDAAAHSVDLANPDLGHVRAITLAPDMISIERTKFLWRGALYERIGVRSFDSARRQFRMEMRYGADFRDLFEVRGSMRPRGGRLSLSRGKAGVDFLYEGLGGVKRRTRLQFWPEAGRVDHRSASFSVDLGPYERASMSVSVGCSDKEEEPRLTHFSPAYRDRRRFMRTKIAADTAIESSNGLFNEMFRRAPPTSTCWCHRRRTVPIPTPAFPGIRRRSDATESSPR